MLGIVVLVLLLVLGEEMRRKKEVSLGSEHEDLRRASWVEFSYPLSWDELEVEGLVGIDSVGGDRSLGKRGRSGCALL